MSNFYTFSAKEKSIKQMILDIEKASALLKKYPECSDISEIYLSDTDKITANLFTVCLALLASSEEKERESGFFYDGSYDRICMKNVPVSMDFDSEKLTVSTPLTIKRAGSKSDKVAKENFILQSFVEAKMNEFKEQFPEKMVQIYDAFQKKFLTLYIIRSARKFNPNLHCDNDNLECGRIQNLICRFAGISDRADNMDVHLCYRTCATDDECGTKFVLTGSDKPPEIG